MDVKTLAEMVELMRVAQQKYFRERTAAALNESKRLEKMVDDTVKSLLHPELDGQQRLF